MRPEKESGIGLHIDNFQIMVTEELISFATRYTQAWCSGNPANVAAFFVEGGSLTINNDASAVGREAIANSAQEFMTSFPDMVVTMDRLAEVHGQLRYYWTMSGTNTGPGGTGKSLQISGYEALEMADSGLIQSAIGHYDELEWARQVH